MVVQRKMKKWILWELLAIQSIASDPLFRGLSPYRQQLLNRFNTQYFAAVQVGGQNMTAVLDSGSFDTLVVSSKCEDCFESRSMRAYRSFLSPSYHLQGSTAIVQFGSGPTEVLHAYDSVQVGPFVSQNQSIWEITDHDMKILDTVLFNAIVGVGPRNSAFRSSDPTLLQSFGVETFSVCLERGGVTSQSELPGPPGWFTWNAPIRKNNPGFYAELPLIGELHWAVNLTGASIVTDSGTVSTGVCQGGCAAIIDTGTSLLIGPSLAIDELISEIGPIDVDCSNVHALPIVSFRMGDGVDVQLSPETYVMRVELPQTHTSLGDWILKSVFAKTSLTRACVPAFMPMETETASGPLWIMGMPFFRQFTTTFDRQGQRVLLSRSTDDCVEEPFTRQNESLRLVGIRRHETSRVVDVNLDQVSTPTWLQQPAVRVDL